jgi:hypothetical protein
MNLTGKHLTKVALKLGLVIKEGSKHILVYDQMGNFVTIFPGAKLKRRAPWPP